MAMVKIVPLVALSRVQPPETALRGRYSRAHSESNLTRGAQDGVTTPNVKNRRLRNSDHSF